VTTNGKQPPHDEEKQLNAENLENLEEQRSSGTYLSLLFFVSSSIIGRIRDWRQNPAQRSE
jgi:hypothetical protein